MAEVTPMLRQYFDIKKDYEDYILFYRLGDFYEMFYDDAITASKVLDITLTKRNAGSGKTAPLAGVPYHSCEQYLKKLVDSGYKVAICEQVEDPKAAKGLVKREVVKLITPGTISDIDMLKEDANNYLMAISQDENNYVMCFGDLSTGMLKYRVYDLYEEQRLIDSVYILRPSEIIIREDLKILDKLRGFIKTADLNTTITTQVRKSISLSFGLESIKSFFGVATLEGFGIDETSRATIDAISRLIDYLKLTQKTALPHMNKIVFDSDKDYMVLDGFTMKNLELVESMRAKSKKGSLLYVLDKTMTAAGKRKLRSYIESPLLDKGKIEERLDRVEFLIDEIFIRSRLTELLDEVYDLERLVTKIVLKTINPRDIVALKNSFSVFPDIKKLFDDAGDTYQSLFFDFNDLSSLKDYLEAAIIDDPPFATRQGNFIKGGFSSELDELRMLTENSQGALESLLEEEREKTGIKNLKVGFNKVFGYYIEVTNANKSLAPDYYVRKQTLSNCERYIFSELKELEDKILSAKEKINILEYKLFMDIVDKLNDSVEEILKSAEVLAKVDVYQSFASVSDKYSYVRPVVTTGDVINLKDARHPVVESMLSYNEFVPNDSYLDNSSSVVNIITGPNMAGKSTYLRQVALISLMMQIGCFVPCSSAEICISDRIFTRVGASDDLYRAQSTFMVEMLELANILNHATSKSLVILDEIGRGTSTFDGLSLAWALVEYISSKLKCKTLFATHYHELTELENTLDTVVNYRITISEKGDDIVFLRKLVRGAANKSFGIEVAKLAGVPNEVLVRARKVLKELEKNDIARPVRVSDEPINTAVEEDEMVEYREKSIRLDKLSDYVDTISLDNTSPISALLHLEQIVKMLRS